MAPDDASLQVDFPASCPHITGCGGTKLALNGTTITSEIAWNELNQQEGATGGGVSQVFTLPAWQQNANVPNSPSGQPGRGVPDVAGDVDPVTGYKFLWTETAPSSAAPVPWPRCGRV